MSDKDQEIIDEFFNKVKEKFHVKIYDDMPDIAWVHGHCVRAKVVNGKAELDEL